MGLLEAALLAFPEVQPDHANLGLGFQGRVRRWLCRGIQAVPRLQARASSRQGAGQEADGNVLKECLKYGQYSGEKGVWEATRHCCSGSTCGQERYGRLQTAFT